MTWDVSTAYVELRLKLSDAVREFRQKKRLTQIQLAEILEPGLWPPNLGSAREKQAPPACRNFIQANFSSASSSGLRQASAASARTK
ncbi:MAG TPA: hypothetical protein VGG20_14995 [Thermoanaerobaculia bacterium]|jgi:hypothetical protein